MEKIKVNVCLGTTCFIMGASNLQNLKEFVGRKYKDKVDVQNNSCLGLCYSNGEFSKAPYVKVNDETVQEATVEKVINEIERQLVNNG